MRLILALACFLIAPFLASLFIGYYFLNIVNDQSVNLSTENLIDSISQRADPVVNQITNMSRSASNDAIILASLSEVTNLMVGGKASNGLQKELSVFLQHEPVYQSISYIDAKGQIVREATITNGQIVFQDKNYTLPDNNPLRQILTKTLILKEGEVYISPIQETFPLSLFYATPIVDDQNKSLGVVILTVNTDYFLGDIRSLKRDGETFFLIDQNGHYLAHPQRSKELGFVTKQENNFFINYPELKDKLNSSTNKDKIEIDGELLTFHYIYPTLGSFALNKGSEKILGNQPEDNFYWTLVSSSQVKNIDKQVNRLRNDYLSYMFLTSSISVLALCLSIIFFLKMYRKHLKMLIEFEKKHE